MSPLLRVEGVESGYGKLSVVHSASMHCNQDELVAIVGPNGAGKTTLMRAIFGLLPVTAGSVHYDGEEVTNLDNKRLARLNLALVPQGGNTFPDLSVADNLHVALSRRGDRRSRLAAIDRIYEEFPRLGERRRQMARTLSGGERQMLALAQGLITEPKLLVLDEPTSGLAPTVVEQLVATIVAIRERGTAVVWVIEENPLQVLEHVDRVHLLQAGTITAEVSAKALLEDTSMQDQFFGLEATSAP
jgi:branched-chain amino acid transport system ATP-binding protein